MALLRWVPLIFETSTIKLGIETPYPIQVMVLALFVISICAPAEDSREDRR